MYMYVARKWGLLREVSGIDDGVFGEVPVETNCMDNYPNSTPSLFITQRPSAYSLFWQVHIV